MLISSLLLSIIKFILVLIPYVSSLNPLSLTKPVTDGFGVNIHFTHPKDGELEMLASAGFKWVRMDFKWTSVEHNKGEYNFTDYDFLLTELEKHNISAHFILDYGNTLYDEPIAVISEEGRKAYARWTTASVQHFKGRGIVWEIWNEPNIKPFWNGSPDVRQYIAMALEAVKAIKSKTPNEILIGPASSLIDLWYLEECFKSGLLNYWDAVSVHPYRTSNPETVSAEYFELKKIIAKYTPKGKIIPIISGEWGYSSVWKNFNESLQASYLPRMLLTNAMHNIAISVWFEWHNQGITKSVAGHNFGTVQFEYHSGLKPVYTPKDAYLTAKTMSDSLKGFQFVKRIFTNDSKDYVLLFKNGNDLRLAVWTTSSVEHQISIPSDICDFDIIYSKGDKIEKTSAKDGILRLTVNEFPNYIVIKESNHAIENGADVNLFNVNVEPINGKQLFVKLSKLYENSINGTIRLTDIKGIDPTQTEIKFQISNEFEKVISISLKYKPLNEFTIGVNVESHGSVVTSKVQTYQIQSNQLLTDSISKSAEHSVSVHSAPETLSDSDSTVLKIDYYFVTNGSKFFTISPKNAENRKISGEPKVFGIWVYGDNEGMTIRMRISDATHQAFQLHQENSLNINWKGWKFVTFNQIETHWGGSNDGKVHYPVEYSTLFLMDNTYHSNINSTVYITSPIIIY